MALESGHCSYSMALLVVLASVTVGRCWIVPPIPSATPSRPTMGSAHALLRYLPSTAAGPHTGPPRKRGRAAMTSRQRMASDPDGEDSSGKTDQSRKRERNVQELRDLTSAMESSSSSSSSGEADGGKDGGNEGVEKEEAKQQDEDESSSAADGLQGLFDFSLSLGGQGEEEEEEEKGEAGAAAEEGGGGEGGSAPAENEVFQGLSDLSLALGGGAPEAPKGLDSTIEKVFESVIAEVKAEVAEKKNAALLEVKLEEIEALERVKEELVDEMEAFRKEQREAGKDTMQRAEKDLEDSNVEVRKIEASIEEEIKMIKALGEELVGDDPRESTFGKILAKPGWQRAALALAIAVANQAANQGYLVWQDRGGDLTVALAELAVVGGLLIAFALPASGDDEEKD